MKKIIGIISVLALCSLLIFSFTACENEGGKGTDTKDDANGSDKEHVHTEVIDNAVEPTCTKTGLTEGKHCSVCDEIIVKQKIIPAQHKYEENVCTVCGCLKISEGLKFTLDDDKESYSVTGIGECKDKDVVIPSTYKDLPVTSIGNYAFSSCKNLTSVTIPDSVTSIDFRAFHECTGLKSVTIGNSVTSIGYEAFCYCRNLTSVTIPDSVKSIVYNAFSDCNKLVEVYNLSRLSITKGTEDNGRVGYYALNVYTPTSGEKKTFVTEDGYIFYEDKETCCLLGYKGKEKELTLPKDCNGKTYEIYQYAFYKNTNITSVTIPNSVTNIGTAAFEDCSSLKSVTIPNSVTGIGERAFRDCDSITSVIIGNGVTSIEREAFSSCDSLTSVTIGNSVASIGRNAFDNCISLTDVIIPNSVTSIDNYAFNYCNIITSVYYKGSASNWSEISIASNGNNKLISTTRYYYSEEKPTETGNYWHYDNDGNIAEW